MDQLAGDIERALDRERARGRYRYVKPAALTAGYLGAYLGGRYGQRQVNKPKTGKSGKRAKAKGYSGGKWGPPAKSNKKLSKDVKVMKAKLVRLKKMDDATTGTATVRFNSTRRMLNAVNKQQAQNYSLNSTEDLELVLSKLKYFDPTNPEDLITASAADGTYQRNMLIDYASITVLFRNNYITPLELDIYYCKCKDDTDQTVISAWDAGVPDGSNLTDRTDLNQYPSDYNVVKDLYKLDKIKEVILEPGNECSVSHNETMIEYDPATVDIHALSHQKEYKCGFFLAIAKGVIGHDPTTDSQGRVQIGLDIEVRKVYRVKYSAGINISYTDVDNDYDAILLDAIVSNKPVAFNQNYLVGSST